MPIPRRIHPPPPGPYPPPQAAGRDLVDLLDREQIKTGHGWDFIAGHSLGGKVALESLQQIADLACKGASPADLATARRLLPRQVWVLDSIPGTRVCGRGIEGSRRSSPRLIPCKTKDRVRDRSPSQGTWTRTLRLAGWTAFCR